MLLCPFVAMSKTFLLLLFVLHLFDYATILNMTTCFPEGSIDSSKTCSLKFEPHTLFTTKCDEEVDSQSLPKFCFPWLVD